MRKRRKYALIFLFFFVFIMYYKYFRVPPGQWKMSRKVGLSANSSQFTLEGLPFQIIAGSIHYFRVPRAYWWDRLMKMKACGINTLTTYVPWSLHQPEREMFNFKTHLDLESYISLAAEIGLWVIVCPGPYISSELDLGGLPSWLLRDKQMRLRTTYQGFTDAVNTYFDALIPKLVHLQFKKGGPVIAVQVENGYGSYAKDERYMDFVKKALQSRGINELLLTSDNRDVIRSGGVDGAIRSLKLQKFNQRDLQELTALQPNGPFMVMDFWTGWYDVWGDLHHMVPPENTVATMKAILRRGMSINLYMFHGGSSFGFMSGALAEPSYRALVPSYDYDAPLSEAGEYTPKYHLIRDLLSHHSREENFPPMPSPQYRQAYEETIVYQHLPLWDALSFTEGPVTSQRPVNMESLPFNNGNGQSSGYVLYETIITSGGLLKSGNNVRDRALVFVDRTYIGLLKRQTAELPVPDGKGRRTLSFLVENCGRVHTGKSLDKQHKGLVGDILLNNVPLRNFTTYSLDMKPSFIDSLYKASWKTLPENPVFPGFFMGRLFVYGYASDTFVKLPGWGKGVVFINGINLGRYWSIGPQQALYLPGPLLNNGYNQVIIFEEQEGDYMVQYDNVADLGMAVDIL